MLTLRHRKIVADPSLLDPTHPNGADECPRSGQSPCIPRMNAGASTRSHSHFGKRLPPS